MMFVPWLVASVIGFQWLVMGIQLAHDRDGPPPGWWALDRWWAGSGALFRIAYPSSRRAAPGADLRSWSLVVALTGACWFVGGGVAALGSI